MLCPAVESSPSFEIFSRDFIPLADTGCFTTAIAPWAKPVKARLKVAFMLKCCLL